MVACSRGPEIQPEAGLPMCQCQQRLGLNFGQVFLAPGVWYLPHSSLFLLSLGAILMGDHLQYVVAVPTEPAWCSRTWTSTLHLFSWLQWIYPSNRNKDGWYSLDLEDSFPSSIPESFWIYCKFGHEDIKQWQRLQCISLENCFFPSVCLLSSYSG